jgi:O-antigen/teichoic acid export membrane protein
MLRQLYAQVVGPGFGGMLARVAAGMAITQMAGMALALVVGLVLARVLGPHGLGIYSLAMSIVAVASIPTEFGLPTYLMREAAATIDIASE